MLRKNYSRAIFAGITMVAFSTSAFAFKPYRSQQAQQKREPVFRLTAEAAQDTPTSAPFDGGLSLLIAAGLGYAGKKGLDKRKQLKVSENLEK